MELLQESTLPSCQPLPGWVATRIQPTQTSMGRNASDERARRHPQAEPLRPGADVIRQRDHGARRRRRSPSRARSGRSSGFRSGMRPKARGPPAPQRARASDRGTRRTCRSCAFSHLVSLLDRWNARPLTRDAPTLIYSSASLRASNEADQSSPWNSSSVAIASSANMCSTTPISRSLWNGTSMWGCETRLSDSRRQLGQRTASPTGPSVAASSAKDEGKTGRGCSSG